LDRRCEFWLEFENGVRMHAEMLDKVQPLAELIPPIGKKSEAIKTAMKIED